MPVSLNTVHAVKGLGFHIMESMEKRDGVIWLDGKFVPWQESKVHVLTHSLHYGGSVFEGERVYSGRIFKSAEHTQRLIASAQILGYKLPFDAETLENAKRETVEKSGITEGYMRVIAWRGADEMGLAAHNNTIHVAIAVWPWGSYFTNKLEGIRLGLAQWRRPAPDTAPCNAKTSGLYTICTMSKHAAEAQGYDDALMLDYRGLVAEATGANIFFQQGDTLHTPTPDCFLDGITRRTVIGLAQARGVKIAQRAIQLDELEGFDACFITGSAAEITPVREINGKSFEVSNLVEALVGDYDDLVRNK